MTGVHNEWKYPFRMDTVEFARRLGNLLRTSRGNRPQYAVADDAGISNSSLSNYERGATVPPIRTLARLLTVLGIEPAELLALLDGTPEPEPNGHEVAA